MILRRIVENVRARDWFAVGSFVGLEDSNWNEEGKSTAQERS